VRGASAKGAGQVTQAQPGTRQIRDQITQNNNSTIHHSTRGIDMLGRVTGMVSRTPNGGILASAGHLYDDRHRRKNTRREDGTLWEYSYNDRSEVTSAVKNTAAPALVPGLSFGYVYDGMGNRITSTAGTAPNVAETSQVMPGELEVALCASHEKSPRVGYQDEPAEIHVAAIHQIEGSCFEQRTVEPAHIVLPCTGNADAGRNRPAQIDLGMKFDARLGLTEIGPWKKRQRQVDGRGGERVDRVVQIQAKILARIERSGLLHQTLGVILPDPPVSRFVGIGECGFCNRLGESKMIERLGPCVEAGRYVAQPIPGSHLRENHAGELLSESKMADRGKRGPKRRAWAFATADS
jgi:hypothetical protein